VRTYVAGGISALRFGRDDRLAEVKNLLATNMPVVLTVSKSRSGSSSSNSSIAAAQCGWQSNLKNEGWADVHSLASHRLHKGCTSAAQSFVWGVY
jgi:hypothetical protein